MSMKRRWRARYDRYCPKNGWKKLEYNFLEIDNKVSLRLYQSIKSTKLKFIVMGKILIKSNKTPASTSDLNGGIGRWEVAQFENVNWILQTNMHAPNMPKSKPLLSCSTWYFNTSSSKCILDVLEVGLNQQRRSAVTINWHYEEDDEDMLGSRWGLSGHYQCAVQDDHHGERVKTDGLPQNPAHGGFY